MNPIRIFFLLACLLVSLPSAADASMPDITADKTSFDPLTMTYELTGHVRVATKDRIITADYAKGTMTSMEVWANGSITLVQDDIFFTGDTLYLDGEGHHADITGGARYERNGLVIVSDRASFNWDTKLAEFTGNGKKTLDGKTETFTRLTYNVVTGEFISME